MNEFNGAELSVCFPKQLSITFSFSGQNVTAKWEWKEMEKEDNSIWQVWRWREKTHASSPSTGGKTHEKTSVIQTRRLQSIALLTVAQPNHRCLHPKDQIIDWPRAGDSDMWTQQRKRHISSWERKRQENKWIYWRIVARQEPSVIWDYYAGKVNQQKTC